MSRPKLSDASMMMEALDRRQMLSGTIIVPLPPQVAPTPWVIHTGPGDNTVKALEIAGVIKVIVDGVTNTRSSSLVSSLTIFGENFNDYIDASGMDRPVTLVGGAGTDTLLGGAGADLLYGGDQPKPNTPFNSDEDFGDSLVGNGGNDTVNCSVYGYESTVQGDAGNDSITGGAGDDSIDAGAGDDRVFAGAGANYVLGGNGNDLLVGGRDRDSLYGGAGNDVIVGHEGDDFLSGGDGNDSLEGDTGNDYITGDAGNDTLTGNEGNDQLYGGLGDDLLNGGNGSDYEFGGDGNDYVNYFDRTDNLVLNLDGKQNDGAAKENDWIGADIENIIGGKGNDLISGNSTANVLDGGDGNDTEFGQGGADTLFGDAGNDALYGGDGSDQIHGGAGDDQLYGEHDKDSLFGELGNDTVVALGGDKDYIDPGNSTEDMLWMGVEDTYNASVPNRNVADIHKIANFYGNQPLEPDGQLLTDPSLIGAPMNPHYTSAFADTPLFNGDPQMSDIHQQKLGTCYFLAGLASIARVSPLMIRRNIVDLGDGTFAARLFVDGKITFFRVDGDLPAVYVKGKEYLCYAVAANKALWVPIMEKVLAVRYGDWDNASGGLTYRAFDLFGVDHDTDIVAFHSESTMAARMRGYLLSGGAVLASTQPGILGTSLPELHVYTVLSVSGDLKTVTIRNPWGVDDKGFKFQKDDGIEQISIGEFDDDFLTIAYSHLTFV